MNEDDIRQILKAALGDCEIDMQAEGNKINLHLVGSVFADLNRVKRQQLVYNLLKDKISSGEIHAVTMKCLTPQEAQ